MFICQKDFNQYSTAVIVWLSKLPTTILTSMINVPFGRQWKLIAMNVLEVSRSLNNSIYLPVMQDYIPKLVDVLPLRD